MLCLLYHVQTKITEPLALWMLEWHCLNCIVSVFCVDYGTSLINVLLMKHAQSVWSNSADTFISHWSTFIVFRNINYE